MISYKSRNEEASHFIPYRVSYDGVFKVSNMTKIFVVVCWWGHVRGTWAGLVMIGIRDSTPESFSENGCGVRIEEEKLKMSKNSSDIGSL